MHTLAVVDCRAVFPMLGVLFTFLCLSEWMPLSVLSVIRAMITSNEKSFRHHFIVLTSAGAIFDRVTSFAAETREDSHFLRRNEGHQSALK